MADFVLVHGAWSGSQSYDKTAADLAAAGHRPVVVQLRGLGRRHAELHPGITLSDHIDDACQQLEQAGVGRFVLAGHSYGGMVITGVAARLGARIDALCYLDAFVPADGQSLWDLTGDYEHRWYIDSQKHTPGLVAPIGQTGFRPVPGIVGRHPLLTLTEAVQLTGEEAKIPRRSYVFASDWTPSPFVRFVHQLKGDPAWEYHVCRAGHHLMQEQPAQVLSILLGLAAA